LDAVSWESVFCAFTVSDCVVREFAVWESTIVESAFAFREARLRTGSTNCADPDASASGAEVVVLDFADLLPRLYVVCCSSIAIS
jgi:hypothetical protein